MAKSRNKTKTCLQSQAGTGHCYYLTTSVLITLKKLVKKYDPVVRKHVMYKPVKLK